MHSTLSGVALVLLWCGTVASTSALPRWKVIQSIKDTQPAYDYVVIGGGTAGLTVADRLTKDGRTTVLVIEHGELGECARSARDGTLKSDK